MPGLKAAQGRSRRRGGGAYAFAARGLPLLFMVLTGCSSDGWIRAPLTPIIHDGFHRCDFGHLTSDIRLRGNWTLPRRADRRETTRIAEHPQAGVSFQCPEPMALIIRFNPVGTDTFRVTINGHVHEARPPSFTVIVPADQTRRGENRVFIVPGRDQKLHFRSIDISPGGRVRNLKKRYPQRVFAPADLVFYLDPNSAREIDLRLSPGRSASARWQLLSETAAGLSESRLLKVDRRLRLRPRDRSIHRFTLRIRGSEYHHVIVEDCREIRRPATDTEPEPRRADHPRNVLLIVLDAARADHMGVYGYPRDTTPHIDRLADSALVFSNCHSEAAYTLASTTTLMTGLPPDCHGVLSPLGHRMGTTLTRISELFRERGFFTGVISANSFLGRAYGMQRGFTDFVELFTEKEAVATADRFPEPFAAMLKSTGGRPFFIYLHLLEPHTPYAMPPPFLGSFQQQYREQSEALQKASLSAYESRHPDAAAIRLINDLYDENLRFADHIVGRILDTLAAQGFAEDTLVILTADHGEALGERGEIGHNVVLHREGIHIPLILKIPGTGVRPHTIDRPAITSDIVVTLADWYGLDYPYRELSLGRHLLQLPEQRMRFCRSVPFLHGYSWFTVQTATKKVIFRTPLDAAPMELFEVTGAGSVVSPIPAQGLDLDYLLARFELDIARVAGRFSGSPPPRLRERDINTLKSLGYIQ